MPRALWSGSLTFGLVNIPVRLHSAVRDIRPRFRLLHRKDDAPISYQKVCQREGKPVAWEDLVKGYEYEKGRFVVLTRDDFETAALEKSRSVEILDFVEGAEIDTRYFDVPYYIVPDKGAGHAYAVLRDALKRTGRVGIARIILRQVQHLAAVLVVQEALVLCLLRFADEIVDIASVPLPERERVNTREVKLAQMLIDSLAAEWEPEKYRDEYRDNLMRIINAKKKGRTARLKSDTPDRDTKVVDLMERLQKSLEASQPPRKRRTTRTRTSKRGRKASAA